MVLRGSLIALVLIGLGLGIYNTLILAEDIQTYQHMVTLGHALSEQIAVLRGAQ